MGTFQGYVDDLDFTYELDWCQAILRKDGEQLVAVTKEPRMQSLLELAFATRKYAEVSYKEGNPNKLMRVKVNIEYPPTK
jgi:hypothetical protein